MGKAISLECPVMLNNQLEIVEDESVTSIDRYDEFCVNLLFDRSTDVRTYGLTISETLNLGSKTF